MYYSSGYTAVAALKYRRQQLLRDRSTAVASLNVRPRNHNNNLGLGNRSMFVFSDDLNKVHKFVSHSRKVKHLSFYFTFS